jgi:hypothetical protein
MENVACVGERSWRPGRATELVMSWRLGSLFSARSWRRSRTEADLGLDFDGGAWGLCSRRKTGHLRTKRKHGREACKRVGAGEPRAGAASSRGYEFSQF